MRSGWDHFIPNTGTVFTRRCRETKVVEVYSTEEPFWLSEVKSKIQVDAAHYSQLPWVYNKSLCGVLEGCFFSYIDDIRPAIPHEGMQWGAIMRCLYGYKFLVVQDIYIKKKYVNQDPWPQYITMNHTNKLVVVWLSLDKWQNTRRLIRVLADLMDYENYSIQRLYI